MAGGGRAAAPLAAAVGLASLIVLAAAVEGPAPRARLGGLRLPERALPTPPLGSLVPQRPATPLAVPDLGWLLFVIVAVIALAVLIALIVLLSGLRRRPRTAWTSAMPSGPAAEADAPAVQRGIQKYPAGPIDHTR